MSKVGYITGSVLILSSLVCSLGSGVSEPQAIVAPIRISGGLANIDVCQAIPQEDIEAVMGRKLARAPRPLEYSEAPGIQ